MAYAAPREALSRGSAVRALAAALPPIAGASPAAALFHLAVVSELLTSYDGDPAVQAVEIEMLTGLQTFPKNSVLAAFDEAGQYVADVLVVPDNVANGGEGMHWLMGTTAFEAASGIQVDFEFTAGLPWPAEWCAGARRTTHSRRPRTRVAGTTRTRRTTSTASRTGATPDRRTGSSARRRRSTPRATRSSACPRRTTTRRTSRAATPLTREQRGHRSEPRRDGAVSRSAGCPDEGAAALPRRARKGVRRPRRRAGRRDPLLRRRLHEGALTGSDAVETCAASDARVAKAQAKLAAAETKHCDPAELPDFAYEPASETTVAVANATNTLLDVLWGPDPDAALVSREADARTAKCQVEVAKRLAARYEGVLKAAAKAQKRALATADTADALASAVEAALASDPKLARADQVVAGSIGKRCQFVPPPDPPTRFPGSCSSAANALDLGECVADLGMCVACVTLQTTTELLVDCDALDGEGLYGNCVL